MRIFTRLKNFQKFKYEKCCLRVKIKIQEIMLLTQVKSKFLDHFPVIVTCSGIIKYIQVLVVLLRLLMRVIVFGAISEVKI